MKLARFVLKIVGASLAVAGFVCLIIGYWDRLTHCFSSCGDKAVKVVDSARKKPRPAEYDDFADVD